MTLALSVIAVMMEIEKGRVKHQQTTMFSFTNKIYLIRKKEQSFVDDLIESEFDSLLPSSDYFSFHGSLTTPPCTENVVVGFRETAENSKSSFGAVQHNSRFKWPSSHRKKSPATKTHRSTD